MLGGASAEMPVIIFVTKIDEHEPGLLGDLRATFHSQRIFDIVQVSVSCFLISLIR